MVERDEDSRNGKRTVDETERRKQQQQSPPTFVNHFARYIESNVSYAEALRLGHKNQGNPRRDSAVQGDSGTNTAAAPSQSDGNLSRSYSNSSFDSSAPSTPSLRHSISSRDLESRDCRTENEISVSGHDFSNYFSSSTTNPSGSIKALYFGKLESCLSLPKSFPYQYSFTSTDRKATSNGKHPTPSPSPPPPPPYCPSRIPNSDILREELRRLIKRSMESGKSILTNDLIFNF